MPVYEYECSACEKVYEVQQRMVDDPLSQCPECEGPVTKIMSRSSFQLKGGGWYADGYASTNGEKKKDSTPPPAPSSTPPCKTGGSCPCASATS
ncbi:MAG: zinc ribbon domain-containing protein [Desulfocapsa sp.]|nr:zinc ribbon domain-containing protein [Desulfocapsa sp.]